MACVHLVGWPTLLWEVERALLAGTQNPQAVSLGGAITPTEQLHASPYGSLHSLLLPGVPSQFLRGS